MNQATRDFIRRHADGDVRQLALQGGRAPEVDLTFALDQIAGRQTARQKLPSLAAVEGVIYPPHLSMEQCSSEQTARYKASLVADGGELLVDLTAGFGIDALFLSKPFKRVVCVERQPGLCAISLENFQLLGRSQVEVVCAEAEDYLHGLARADLIYIDPARRDSHGARTYGMADCTPNVLSLMDELMTKTPRLLLKLSPMLDWRKALADVQQASAKAKVAEVHIVSVDNECKELLLDIRVADGRPQDCRVVCVNLLSDGSRQVFAFDGGGSENRPLILASEVHHLHIPNASLMKAGCFCEIARRWPVAQLDANSHLFVSAEPVADFPGRSFRIECITSMNKRELRQALDGITQANISVRNFPMTAAELRKRLRLRDGGDLYIVATTVAGEGHRLLLCRKIS